MVTGFETIPDPRIRHNIAWGIRRSLEFLAELGDEHAEILDLFRALSSPDRGEQCAMRHDFPGVANQVEQQVKFFWREMDGAILY